MTEEQITPDKPSFTMEIPYIRVYGKYPFNKTEVNEVKILKFESSVLITVSRILKLVSTLPTEFVGSTKHDISNNILVKHKATIIEIIALSIQNSRIEVDPELINFIDDNFTTEHLMEAFNYVMICLNLDSLIMGVMIFKPSIQASFDNAKAHEPEIRQITSC